MTLSTPLVMVRLQDVDSEPLVHLAPHPYTHALRGTPPDERPLKPCAEPSCVVCIDLASRR